MRFGGKVALVTGGASGIGRAVALRLAGEGAMVVAADVNEEGGKATAEEIGGEFVSCDVSSPEQALSAVRRTVEFFGGLDVLVNSAAHLGGFNNAAEMPESEWREVLSVSLDGVFYCSKFALPELVGRGGGAVVHVSSAEGIAGVAGHAAYVTAKSALFGLTRSMAIDFGRQAVRVNSVSPGIIDTGRPDIELHKQDPTWMTFWRDMTVLERLGRPEEAAAAVAFLASDEASYITGQNLAVDGGWTIGHPPLPPP